MTQPIGNSPEERFWAKVGVGPECWEWQASRKPEGYGQLRRNGKTLYAHRVAYEFVKGPVPEGWHVDHLCRNRACVNPGHLEAVPHAENIRRGYAAKGPREFCKRGHPFTPENTYVTPATNGRTCIACRDWRMRRWLERRKEET